MRMTKMRAAMVAAIVAILIVALWFSNGIQDRASLTGGSLFGTETAHAATLDPENTLYLETKYGRVVIALRPDIAPNHVARIKKLAREGFYDGIVFHRVIDGFMAQTGDPTGTGAGGSELPDLKAEFSRESFTRGTLGMARSRDPNSANSQFFIMFDDGPFLNGKYTIFGKVVSGMEFIDKIKRGEPVKNPDKMISLRVAADVDKQ